MPRGGPSVCLAFQFPTPAELDATFAELTTAGYRGPRAVGRVLGTWYATVLDRDGNGIDLWRTGRLNPVGAHPAAVTARACGRAAVRRCPA